MIAFSILFKFICLINAYITTDSIDWLNNIQVIQSSVCNYVNSSIINILPSNELNHSLDIVETISNTNGCYISCPEEDNINVMPMPGVKCPKCAEISVEPWVLPGKHCPKCGHPC